MVTSVDSYKADIKRANDNQIKVETLFKEKEIAANKGQSTTKYNLLIQTAKRALKDDVDRMDRAAHMYSTSKADSLSKKEKSTRLNQINRFVDQAK